MPESCASLQFFKTLWIFIISGSEHLGSSLILSFERCSDQIQVCLQKKSSVVIIEYLDVDVKIDFLFFKTSLH